jgi:hypothetical protein
MIREGSKWSVLPAPTPDRGVGSGQFSAHDDRRGDDDETEHGPELTVEPSGPMEGFASTHPIGT